MEAPDEFALGLGQVERRPVGLTHHRGEVDGEEGSSRKTYQVWVWPATIPDVDMVPEYRNTAAKHSAIAIS